MPEHGLPRAQSAISTGAPDGALQDWGGGIAAEGGAQSVPGPVLTFEGLGSADDLAVFGGRVLPPDVNGDVGPGHYVQSVNLLLRVFDKSGTALTSPFKMSSLFASLGGVCATGDDGDPIVLYDQLADRWFLSQLGLPSGTTTPPYHQCIAVSASGDPTGVYFVYDFVMPGNYLNDYPKFGVWPDGYYMTDNQFQNGGPFRGTGVFAFDRQRLLAGDPSATYIYFNLYTVDPTVGGMLPADADGLMPPPAGRPNTFAYVTAGEFGDPQGDALRLFDFHADFAAPANSTFTERPESPIAVAAFDPSAPSGVPQPSPGVALDPLSDRLMHRLQYRNFGTHESLITTHTVRVTTSPYKAGVRYYELRRSLPAGTFGVPEQATFSPDASSRWMGSAAMDHQGNLAVGYSVSSATVYPSIRYAARLAGDPPNQLAQGEATLVSGSGVQTDPSGRWGDYSALSVDSVGDCEFWYTNEYYTAAGQAASQRGWQTRIGSFALPSCVPALSGALSVRVTDCATQGPIAAASVATDDGYFRVTDAAGVALFTAMTPDAFLVTASRSGFLPATGSVGVIAGSTASLDLCLVSVSSPTISGVPTPTATPIPPSATATPTAVSTELCVTFRTGVCCTDTSGTSCSTTVCTSNAGCTAAPFLTCGGASANDGRVNHANSSVYPPTSAIVADSTFNIAGTQRSRYAGPSYAVQNGLLRFDTGSILPDTATITSATLTAQVTEVPGNADGLSLTGEWYDWSPAVGIEDFSHDAAATAFSVPIASVSLGSNSIALSTPANVSLTGFTYLRTHVSERPNDAAPTGTNLVKIALFDHTSQPGPALQICYSLMSPTPTATPSPSPTGAPSASPSSTATATASATPVATPTATATSSPAATNPPPPSATPTATSAPTQTASLTPSQPPTQTATTSATPTETIAASATPTASATAPPAPTSTPVSTPTATATASATPTAASTCVTFRTGVCCTDASGTSCSATVCTSNTACTAAPFLTCGGASANDGRVNRANSSAYPPTSAIAADSTFNIAGTQRSRYAGPSYAVQNGLLRFDTGAILPDTATITSATLTAQVTEVPGNADGLSLTGEWYDWSPAVGIEDFSHDAAATAFSVPIASVSLGSNSIALSTPANVSLTGFTYLRTHVSQRPNDAAPTGTNLVKIALFDHTSQPGPALQVCYSAAPPAPTATPTDSPTATLTATFAPTATSSLTPSPTPTGVATSSPSATASPTASVTAPPTSTPSAAVSATATDTPPAAPATSTSTPTLTLTAASTATDTVSAGASATPTVTGTATPTAGCVTFRTGVCCTDRSGTNCSNAVCTGDASCTAAPFLACGGLSADDGTVGRSGSLVYPPNTAAVANSAGSVADIQRSVNLGPNFSVVNALLRFDTGTTLPDNAIVTGAALTVSTVSSRNPEGRNLTGEWYDWGPTVGPEDFSQADASTAFSIPAASGLPAIALTDPQAHVSLTGYTYLRLHLSNWPDDPAPVSPNSLQIALFEHATIRGPALQVCYDFSPPVPSATPTPTATPTITATPQYGEGSVTFALGVCCTSAVGIDCEDRSPATAGMQYRVCNVEANCTNPAYPVCAGDGMDDGYTESDFTASYPPPFSRCVMNTGNAFASRSLSSGTFKVRNALVRFATASTLPDDAVIDSATLRLHVSQTDRSNNLSFLGEWYDWASCSAADYTTAAADSAFNVPLAAITDQAHVDFPLTSPESIKTTGTQPTGFRIHLANRPGDAAPTGLNTIPFASHCADLTIEPGPRLIVNYHLPTPTVTPTGPTATPTATATVTLTPTPSATSSATCVVFHTGYCCTDSFGTSCSASSCGANSGCQVYPFLVCAGASANDGHVGRSGSSVYPPTTTVTTTTNGNSFDTQRSASTGPSYAVQNGLMRFNTAPLPDTATVVSAVLVPYLIAPPVSADGLAFTGEWYSWAPSIGPEDFTQAPASSAFSVPVSSLVAGDNSIPLSGAGASVSRAGYTYLRTHISQLPGDAAPTGINIVKVGQFDHITQPGPSLKVCYTP